MQLAFGFGAEEDLAWVRDRLQDHFGPVGPVALRSPVGQLVKSMISSRTRDEVSLAAYGRLVEIYPVWPDLAAAPVKQIETIIGDVTYPEVKAGYLARTLRRLATLDPPLDLRFLRRLTVPQSLAWLERLPGVGRKVAASTLNFSTLQMPAFVIDTHVLRVMGRFGFVRLSSDTEAVYETAMSMADGWSAVELAELHILVKRLGQVL